jgi:hypothetical protein
MLKENNARQAFFEHGESVAFRNALPDYFRPVVTFAYYTGWRKQEILSLKWEADQRSSQGMGQSTNGNRARG